MKLIRSTCAVAAMVALVACAKGSGTPEVDEKPGASSALATSASQATASQEGDQSLPVVVAYKSPTCGCCELWIEHMRTAGFRVEVRDTADMAAIKVGAGVPVGKGSCHTARVGQYYLEGHVPAGDVKRLIAEQPDARGLLVPGMVLGSPGMEQGGVKQPYDVLLLAQDGSTSVYAHYDDGH